MARKSTVATLTANLSMGTKAVVQEKLGNFFAQLAYRTNAVKQRGLTVLQAAATPSAGQPKSVLITTSI